MLRLLCILMLALPVHAQTLRIAAASDLASCIEDLNAGFKQSQPNTEFKVSLGSSGNFYTQIAAGGPFDVFLSADQSYPKQLAASGAAELSTLKPYAIGRLALWTMQPNVVLDLTRLGDAGIKRIAIANPDHAPYGQAARAAMQQAGVWDTVSPKLVLGNNIVQAVQFVQTGNADVGLVAYSLLKSPALSGVGRSLLLPAQSHSPLIQAAIVTRYGKSNLLAASYVDFLQSNAARSTLQRCGFDLPERH